MDDVLCHFRIPIPLFWLNLIQMMLIPFGEEMVTDLQRWLLNPAAAKVLAETDMSAEDIARKSIKVASDICVFTNNNVTVEKV